jgi:transcriptional regulator with XRE-family HTH domain
MELKVLIGGNVRRLRLAAGLSQEELVHRAGIDRTYLSDIERGISNPTVQMLSDIAAVLAVPLVVLLVPMDRAHAIEAALRGP